ncbi:MAG TPA: C4-type zinc ribbon domain-containing protein [Phycisphaerae bacterium]|nr:C4-type zinc ribbon domain-containing protein [Phycisphaerae bacterium]
MGATLDALCRLQEVELQIAEIQRKIDRKQGVVKKQEQRIADHETKIRAWQAAIRTDQMEADRLDLEVKTNESQIAKLRQALNSAKTNKEYSAILTQLNTTKADNSKVEEKVLAFFRQIESKRKELGNLEAERDKEISRCQEAKAALKEVEEKSREKLNQLARDREAAASAVPGKALDTFNRVARKLDGEAMAQVIRTHPKREEYACEGCNMSITIEQVNNILSRDDAVLCNSCGRILYYELPAASHAR